MKIAICASEAVPFAKTGGLADVAGALPLVLEGLGDECAVVLPRYKAVGETKYKLKKTRSGTPYAVIGKNCRAYFVENREYYDRSGLYGDKTGDYKDNLERFSFFCRRALELLEREGFCPQIIHCHDWQTSLIPVYLKTIFRDNPFFRGARSVLTIHNIGYQGLFEKEKFALLGLDWSLFNMEQFEFWGKVNILKAGMVFADVINTVSPTYSKEIQTSEFGYGLEGVLQRRSADVFGILNGLDYSIWDPGADPYIAKRYTTENLKDKYENKDDLLKACGFSRESDLPLFGIVSRLAEQKGLDILSDALEALLRRDLRVVILGTGDAKYHVLLDGIARRFPRKLSLHLAFDDSLAHKIYAGSDIFLMPSKYEPCGLGQLISLRYGTVPLVYRTGGLADTINPQNGFSFDAYTAEALLREVDRALAAYRDKGAWRQLMLRAMLCDFSWEESGRRYQELYAHALAT